MTTASETIFRRYVLGGMLVALVVLLGGCGGPGGGTKGVLSVTISNAPASGELAVGATLDLDVTVSVSGGASQAVAWASSNTAAATVDTSGVVSAKAVGTTSITATSTVDAGKSDAVQLTVVTDSACAPLELPILIGQATTLQDRGNARLDYVSNAIAVNVQAPVIIEPGETIAFREAVGLSVEPGGSIDAVGTPDEPITFTALVEEPGAWLGIDLGSDLPSVLQHVVVEYGVENIEFASAADTSLTLKDTTVRHSLEVGLEVISNVASSDLTGFAANTFRDNPIAVRLQVGNLTQLDGASSYAEPGDATVIVITGGPKVGTRSDGTWRVAGVPYVITGAVSILHHITVEDGASFYFDDGAFLDVETGSLSATGSSEGIVFSGTEAVPGHWEGLFFYSDEANVLDNVTVEYGGGRAGNSANVTMLPGSALTLTNSTIAHSADYGLFVIGDVTLSPGDVPSLLAQNTFLDNASGDIEGFD